MGAADIIAMGRPLIADPDLPRKLAERPPPPRPPLRLPVPLHRGDLPQRAGAVRREPGGRPRVGAPGPDRRHRLATSWWPVADPPGSSAPAGWPSAATASSCGRRATASAGAWRSPSRPTPIWPACSTGWSAAREDAGVAHPPGPRRSAPSWRPTCWCGPPAPPGRRRRRARPRRPAAMARRRGPCPGPAGGPRQRQGGGVGRASRPGRRDLEVTLVPDGAVLAPELGLPGRFRLVADVRAAGVTEADRAAVARRDVALRT